MFLPPPPLPQTEPPDTDSSESEMPNPLLVNVSTERSSSLSAAGSDRYHPDGGGVASELAPLPSALERTVRIKKGGDPLGINVEVVDGGASGVLVTSVAKGGAVHRDGRIRTGDFLVSVNHETMRFATNAQARAILRRTQLVSTDVRYETISDPLMIESVTNNKTDVFFENVVGPTVSSTSLPVMLPSTGKLRWWRSSHKTWIIMLLLSNPLPLPPPPLWLGNQNNP